MNVKIKAETIYKNSMFVHGQEKAKDEALKTAETVKCLVPIQDQKFWSDVINFIQCKN
jgi:hypothetical protein